MANVEKWLDIPGYEGVYQVSNIGRVRSLLRKRSDGRRVNPRMLRLNKHRDGHMRAALCTDGAVKMHFVHRLVLLSFVGPCPDNMQGCHANGNPEDNRVENLRWDTCAANQADKVRHGNSAKGEKNGRCKYPESTIRRIFELRLQGMKYKQIEAETGVSWMYAWNIVHGDSWKHLQAEIA